MNRPERRQIKSEVKPNGQRVYQAAPILADVGVLQGPQRLAAVDSPAAECKLFAAGEEMGRARSGTARDHDCEISPGNRSFRPGGSVQSTQTYFNQQYNHPCNQQIFGDYPRKLGAVPIQ